MRFVTHHRLMLVRLFKGSFSDITVPAAHRGEHFLINTQSSAGATVNHNVVAVEPTAFVKHHVVGAGDVVVTFGKVGSLVGLAGSASVEGSALGSEGLASNQNLTVVVDARADPRTLRIDVQRGAVSVTDTGSNRGVFRVLHSRVTRLVVHATDFVSVDHGDNATT